MTSPAAPAADAPTSTILQNERQVVRRAGRQAICSFLEQHTCFSVLRASGKVVVFDTRIPIQLAFYALVEHGTLNVALVRTYVCSLFQRVSQPTGSSPIQTCWPLPCGNPFPAALLDS